MSQMHVLHLVHQYPPDSVGGTEYYTRALARKLARRGHQVTVFYRRNAPGTGQDSWTEEDVRVRVAWSGVLSPTARFLATFRDPSVMNTFERALEESGPDVVHVQHLMGLPVALLRLIQRAGIPFLVTLHDYWWVCANAQLLTNYSQQVCDGPRMYLNCAQCVLARAGRPRSWPAAPVAGGLLAWRNRLLHQGLKAARKLIAPTKFVRRWYAAHGVKSDDIVAIPHGVDLPKTGTHVGHRTGGSTRFVYIGGLSWQKGVHILVEAFGGVRGSAELWVAGDESLAPGYVSRLRTQASPNVRFLGKLTQEEVQAMLVQADAVVVPSLWYETFSLIAHEAFAAGVPVVASRLGALAEAVREGVDGLLVPPGDVAAWRAALQRLMAEPDLLPRLRANVRRPVTLEEHVDRIESVYAGLVDRSLQA